MTENVKELVDGIRTRNRENPGKTKVVEIVNKGVYKDPPIETLGPEMVKDKKIVKKERVIDSILLEKDILGRWFVGFKGPTITRADLNRAFRGMKMEFRRYDRKRRLVNFGLENRS